MYAKYINFKIFSDENTQQSGENYSTWHFTGNFKIGEMQIISRLPAYESF